ncbi:N-ethylammeline chlorohydrolase [Streptococcus pneumoniae]|nr:N-ethylammeline chlorohydrolase [Streptococcus pneumoniae]
MKLTKSVIIHTVTDEVSNHTYGKAMLTWFEEIFEEYKIKFYPTDPSIS